MNLDFGPCYARLQNGVLTLGSAHIERIWKLTPSGTLESQSLLNKQTDTHWLRNRDADEGQALQATPDATLSGGEKTHPVSQTSLHAVLTVNGTTTNTYHFRVFPDACAIGVTLQTSTNQTHETPKEAADKAAPTGVELFDAAKADATSKNDAKDFLALAPPHLRFVQVLFHDQTDNHNELVFENEWLLHTNEAPFFLSGNVFCIENTLTRSGLLFLKAAPLPYARTEKTAHDVHVEPAKRRLALVDTPGYETVTLAYAGGKAGRIAALQNYQRQIRPFVPARDGMLLSNTWGDRNRDARITHDFLHEEIEAGARLGVDVIQIDDGWQKGTTSNSINAKTHNGVWEGFHKANPQFWEPNGERLPHGLAPLVQAARDKGMRFGLWFAPDSDDDFAHFQTDADTILRLYREENIGYVKIDGVKLRTPQGERNLRAFFDRVLEGSNGAVVFDGDVTAEERPGYFGMMDIGPLFVENRYTDWHRYWPHQTLRNIWKLCHYVDPVRLRMEFLNHARNTDKYENDPLAPDTYRPDYLFATVMFTSPLGWFEVSNLPPAYFSDAAPLIATWKKHRNALHSGTILPIGDTPDGTSWTGFASLSPDRKSAILLIFRELTETSSANLDLPLFDDGDAAPTIEVLAGDGGVTWAGAGVPGGCVTAHIPDAQRFVLVRLTASLTPAEPMSVLPIPAP